MTEESRSQDNIIEENSHKGIVEEIASALISKHMDNDPEEVIMNEIDDDEIID